MGSACRRHDCRSKLRGSASERCHPIAFYRDREPPGRSKHDVSREVEGEAVALG